MCGQPDFLEALQKLRLDLCVTAAYGNILPQAFLDIPRWGTLNIHPSLLPQYRGAAPVQRALQVRNIGQNLGFTVQCTDLSPGAIGHGNCLIAASTGLCPYKST